MGRNKGGKNKKFSFEEKLRVCKRYYEHQLSLGDLAKEENISFGNLEDGSFYIGTMGKKD